MIIDDLKALQKELEQECDDMAGMILRGQVEPEHYRLMVARFLGAKHTWERLTGIIKKAEQE